MFIFQLDDLQVQFTKETTRAKCCVMKFTEVKSKRY